MRQTLITIVALSAVCSSHGQWQLVNGYNSMDHGHSAGNAWVPQNLDTMPVFNSIQIIPSAPQLNSTVVEDFFSNGTVTDVGVMFESQPGFDPNAIVGWRVSVWSSVGNAAASGTSLSLNTVATTFVPNSLVTYTLQPSIPVPGPAYSAEMSVNLATGPGQFWIGMAAELDFQSSGVNYFVYILRHTGQFGGPHVLGAGTSGDAWGVNPANGYINGPLYWVRENAAYGVNSVPEPGLTAAVGLGLAALARRRRAR
jgi:hypothetical protein